MLLICVLDTVRVHVLGLTNQTNGFYPRVDSAGTKPYTLFMLITVHRHRRGSVLCPCVISLPFKDWRRANYSVLEILLIYEFQLLINEVYKETP